MPMYNFIKLNVSGDLKWLVKSGDGGGTVDALERIQSEYSELSGDIETGELLKAAVMYDYYVNKLAIFNTCLSTLRIRRVDGLIEVLVDMGFKFAYTDLQTDLNRAETQSKQWIMKINMHKAVLDARKDTQQTQPTEKMWYDSLSAIAKYRTVANINPRNISVMEYISMEQDYTRHVNLMKQNNG